MDVLQKIKEKALDPFMGLYNELKDNFQTSSITGNTTGDYRITGTQTVTASKKSNGPSKLSAADCEKYIKSAYYKMVAEMERVKNTLGYSDEIFDEEKAMSKFFHSLDNCHCPECRYDFGKPLSRGKQCPNCHQKLRVRNFRVVGPTYLNKLDSMYQEWRRYFEATISKQWFENHMKWGISIDPMDALLRIAEVYEKLEDYDNAWRIFSGTEIPTLDIWRVWVTYRTKGGDCTADDMLYVDFWRAEFLDRRHSSKTWKTSLNQVVDAYANVITQACDLRLDLQCHSVLQSIAKLSAMYGEPDKHDIVEHELMDKKILDKVIM